MDGPKDLQQGGEAVEAEKLAGAEKADGFVEIREQNRAATAAAQAAPAAPLSYAEGARRAAEAQAAMDEKIAAIFRRAGLP